MTRILALLALGLFLAGCDTRNDDYLVGTLERDRIELPAELSEPVTELHVREGARVQAGDKLLQLDDTRARSELRKLAAQREQVRRRLDELVRGPREESIREASARLEAAAGRHDAARREHDRLRSLHGVGLASAAALDNAKAALDSAAGERDAARAALDAMLEGTTVEELDQVRAELDAAEADFRSQQILLERLVVHAPRTGTVEALPWKTGSQPPRGGAVAVLLADGPPFVRFFIPVSQRNRFGQGKQVTVHVPGFGDFAGKVRWVSSAAAFTPFFALTEHDRDRLSHAAEVELVGEATATLPAGLPVEIRSPATLAP